MKLWTIQSLEWYENLLRNEVIYAVPTRINWLKEDNFALAYDWLIAEMEQRLGKRPQPNSYPIWAWYQWQDSQKRKPDLRFRGIGNKGEKSVLLEIEKANNQVLLSDFELWHSVLNEWCITDNELEDDLFNQALARAGVEFCDKYAYPTELRQQMIASWQKIFDMDYCSEYSSHPFEQKSIQATFWRLSLEEVRNVRFFTAK